MSDPDPLRHNSSAYDIDVENIKHESEIGPELIHIYQVENKGPSDIVEAKVFILWPSFRPNGDPLLYLTSQPIIEGSVPNVIFLQTPEWLISKAKEL